MSIARVNDIEINYKLAGEGPDTIVLVSGLADAIDDWDLQTADFLEAGYRVLAFDNRGIGGSSKPPGPYTTRLMADDAKALVEQLGISRFHMLGQSMGGMIAQEYALAYQDDLVSLGLANTYAAPGPFCSRMFSLWADMAKEMGIPAVMRDVILWSFTVDYFDEREDELRAFEESVATSVPPLDAYLGQFCSIRIHDTTDRLSRIRVPTLVITGEDDILIPVSLSKKLHDLIENAEWATVIGGHAAIWEHPEPFNEVYLEFIRSVMPNPT